MNTNDDPRLQQLADLVRDIPDFPQPGIIFKDITPILSDAVAFRSCIDLMVERWRSESLTRIVAIDARGFILGGALADRLGLGLALVRKKGKLPHSTIERAYDLEYGTSTLAIHDDALNPGERVLIVDDVLATGGTAAAAARLVTDLRADVAGFAFMMELKFLSGAQKLGAVPIQSLLTYQV